MRKKISVEMLQIRFHDIMELPYEVAREKQRRAVAADYAEGFCERHENAKGFKFCKYKTF